MPLRNEMFDIWHCRCSGSSGLLLPRRRKWGKVRRNGRNGGTRGVKITHSRKLSLRNCIYRLDSKYTLKEKKKILLYSVFVLLVLKKKKKNWSYHIPISRSILGINTYIGALKLKAPSRFPLLIQTPHHSRHHHHSLDSTKKT